MDKNNKHSGLDLPRLRSAAAVAVALAATACQSFAPTEQASSSTEPPVAVADATPAPPSPLPLVAADGPDAALQPITVELIPYLAPLAEDYDLLGELRMRFELPVNDDPAIGRELDWFAGHSQYLERVFGRADSYLYYIAQELEARHMPVDLALLPVVESAFDPFAYSHGRAAGLWQIIPGTGRRLGLEQNWWFDGRRDIVESTRAALDYLAQMHEQFDGDWLLAVAGYNSGEGNVERAIKRAKAAGKPTDFWGIRPYLPVETRTYVPRFLAIRELVAEPEKYEVTLPEVTNAPQFAVVDTGGQIDMSLAAELAGVDTNELYALNPGVNRWATDPNGPHRLLVPAEQADHFESELAALGDRERVQWSRHKVAEGETIGQIADHYHTTVGVLRQVNGLHSNLIRAGHYLMIPHALKSLDRYTLTADARAERQQNVERDGTRVSHVVASGESLWSIAQQYGVNMRALAKWNAMAPGDTLSVGRDLVVWTKDGGSASATATHAAVVPTNRPTVRPASFTNPQIREVTYVVRRGDSLSSIARRFRVTVPKLLEWNKSANQKYLQPGQHLVMYVNVTEQSS